MTVVVLLGISLCARWLTTFDLGRASSLVSGCSVGDRNVGRAGLILNAASDTAALVRRSAMPFMNSGVLVAIRGRVRVRNSYRWVMPSLLATELVLVVETTSLDLKKLQGCFAVTDTEFTTVSRMNIRMPVNVIFVSVVTSWFWSRASRS